MDKLFRPPTLPKDLIKTADAKRAECWATIWVILTVLTVLGGAGFLGYLFHSWLGR